MGNCNGNKQKVFPPFYTCFGATGPTGPTGATPVLTIGDVTTGAAGSSASASITGTAPNFVLNLTIPMGATGPTGPTARCNKSSIYIFKW